MTSMSNLKFAAAAGMFAATYLGGRLLIDRFTKNCTSVPDISIIVNTTGRVVWIVSACQVGYRLLKSNNFSNPDIYAVVAACYLRHCIRIYY